MSQLKKSFSAFGIEYRTVQFSAVEGIQFLGDQGDLHPTQLLQKTEARLCAKKGLGEWVRLDDPGCINTAVFDMANVLPPRDVLNGVMSLIRDFNFGFMGEWQSAKIPNRFIEGIKTVSSNHTESLISQLIQDEVATLKELEEYYSLEDAFKMFDILLVKGINTALSNEAAMKKNKSK